MLKKRMMEEEQEMGVVKYLSILKKINNNINE